MMDYSAFFGGNSSNSYASGLGSLNLSDYSMIKSGTYKKLMKAYYADESANTSKSSSTASSKTRKTSTKSVAEQIIEGKMKGTSVKDSTGNTQLQSQAEALKNAAAAFGKSDVFQGEYGEYDAEKALKAVNSFVDKYNSTLSQAGKVTSKDVGQEVEYMKNMTKMMKQELEKIGITIGDDGKLTVKEETFKNAASANVEAVFSGSNSYAGEIAEKAAAIGSAAFRSSSFYASNGSFYSSATSTFSNQV